MPDVDRFFLNRIILRWFELPAPCSLIWPVAAIYTSLFFTFVCVCLNSEHILTSFKKENPKQHLKLW